jgi:hypothetical protein
MAMKTTKLIFQWAAAVSAFAAAALWWKSSTTRVECDLPPGMGQFSSQIVVAEGGKELFFVQTIMKQSRWNQRAAFATFVSAFLQAIALGLPA